ncbi:WD40 domain-containing Sec31-like protein [Encephalitozoon intestinalis ATCC 50506]|uniref:Protein transport protein SEC31 n=1 Tax=Encephalitozoon intestinalis (strain ATCC 50506) TaxID=876142 RepID=E0S8F6_ENCIT|nr:WD40 domain-containing Sec31-like protein [Encephalitozoon intestinalis ATCC 50506]ADM11950.1 WD40 domain-containing Sec31-like protein [Encephalitozoon intestinalis ATCC 50506]UTX45733.1 WD40 domain-containing protein [Encephalitozoon intestinalis]
MKFNKRCLTVFSDEKPFMAMGTKSKLFDTSFSLTSELFLYDYSLGVQYPPLQTDNKFYKLKWCGWGDGEILATGNEDGKVTLYTPAPEKNISFELLSSCCVLEGDVLGLDFNPSKGVLAAGSSNGKIIFWNLNRLDSQYTSDIPLTSNITCLSWNKKVSRILCAGTDDGKILILDIRAKNVAMTLGGDDITMVSDVMWHPNGSTSILAATNQKRLQCFNLSSDSTSQIGEHESGIIRLSLIDKGYMAASSKEQVDIIEVSSNKVIDTIPVDGIFEVSFSKRDPLMALSYVGGTTEILPRVTTDVLPTNPGCIVGCNIVGKDLYEIEDKKMKDVEEDAFVGKIKKLLYPDGNYSIDRKGLGELLLGEAIGRNNKKNLEVDEELNKKVSGMSLELKLDLEDPLTLALIKGDLEEAYSESVESNKTVPFSQFLALAKGSESLSFDSDDPLILLATAQITARFSDLLEKISTSQWLALLSIISFSPLSDSDFFSNALELANKLGNEEKLLVYAIVNRLDDYFELKESMYRMPKSIYEVRDFFQRYKEIVSDLESMGGLYKSPMISEYFWYASTHGETPTRIKYEDLGINIYLGRATSSISSPKSSSPSIGDSYGRQNVFKRSPSLEPQTRQDSGATVKYGMASIKPNTPMTGPSLLSSHSGMSTTTTSSLGRPIIPGASISSAHKNIVQSPPSPVISQQRMKVPSPPLGPNKSPYSSVGLSAAQKMYIPRPGYKTMPSTPTYNSASKGISQKTYSSMPDISSLSSSSQPVSTYGTMSRGPSSQEHSSQSNVSKPYIPKPGIPSSPSLSPQNNLQRPNIPIPQPQGRDLEPSAQSQASSPQKSTDNLNSEEILKTFESITEGLIEKASSKANLIVRNKLKEVTKRLSIYGSVAKDTFSPLILGGIDRINKEIKNNENTDTMKQKVREIILECTESGENRADLWMPSIYTLLQIVYH